MCARHEWIIKSACLWLADVKSVQIQAETLDILPEEAWHRDCLGTAIGIPSNPAQNPKPDRDDSLEGQVRAVASDQWLLVIASYMDVIV